MEDSIIQSILAINPKAEVSVSANDIKTIVWAAKNVRFHWVC